MVKRLRLIQQNIERTSVRESLEYRSKEVFLYRRNGPCVKQTYFTITKQQQRGFFYDLPG